MKIVLFCENRYAVDILLPLQEEADREGGHEVLWFVDSRKIPVFPLDGKVKWSSNIQQIYNFFPEAVFVPGNIVPYYLSGVKIQIFHGYAAEKKDHWVIRRYFDLYLTQGPYFTNNFTALAKKYGDFEVAETGWTKQDWIYHHRDDYQAEREELLRRYNKKSIVLYAPTFSPKLTSLPVIKPHLERLIKEKDVLLLLKFHPLTKKEWSDEYREWAKTQLNAVFIEQGENITKLELMSDLMISDTSSAIYEFLLLDKPVVTIDSISDDVRWENITDAEELIAAYDRALNDPLSRQNRQWVVENYDPHNDGLCCRRMLQQARSYIDRHGVPGRRKLNLWRKYTSIKTFGKIKR